MKKFLRAFAEAPLWVLFIAVLTAIWLGETIGNWLYKDEL